MISKNIIVDPAFRLMRFPLDSELDFYLKNWFYILFKKNDLELPLIFVLFLKGKQNKKEKNPKCDFSFWKRWSVENRIGFGGQVTYREDTVKTVAPL